MASRQPSGGSPPPANATAQRYAYLVGRLRNRQITMEEATELFAVMDETIRALRTASMRAIPPASVRPAPVTPAERAPPGPAAAGGIAVDDMLTVGVLMIGAGAGVAAALRRKSDDDARGSASPPKATDRGPSSSP